MVTSTPMTLPKSVGAALEKLRGAGYEAYIVGGSVRDALRGVTPHDYDMTTSATPEEVEAVFAGCRVVETGIRHGTVTVLLQGEPVEITTYRVDGDYRDHRHPDSVTFTRSLEEDLARRDFTMNAIAYAPGVGYVDPFGGREDIDAGIIRAVGDPARRFEEDALRILRALRFASVLGFTVEEKTAEAAVQKQELLTRVSGERVREELLKLLGGKAVADVLRRYAGILAVCLPEIARTFGCPQHTPYHLYDVWEHTVRVVAALPEDPVLRLAGLYHDVGKPLTRTTDHSGQDHFYGHPAIGAEALDLRMRELKSDRRSRERAVLLVRRHDERFEPSDARILRLLSEIGYENFLSLCDLRAADNAAQNGGNPAVAETAKQIRATRARGEALVAAGACFRMADLAVNGRDLTAATRYRGHELGDALHCLLDAVMNGAVPNERDALLAYLAGHPLP